MSVNQRSLDEVVLAYIEAWSTPDAALRRELLDMSLADNGSYTDPVYEVRGKEELADLIGRSLSGEAYGGAGAGARIPIRGGFRKTPAPLGYPNQGGLCFTLVILGKKTVGASRGRPPRLFVSLRT